MGNETLLPFETLVDTFEIPVASRELRAVGGCRIRFPVPPFGYILERFEMRVSPRYRANLALLQIFLDVKLAGRLWILKG